VVSERRDRSGAGRARPGGVRCCGAVRTAARRRSLAQPWACWMRRRRSVFAGRRPALESPLKRSSGVGRPELHPVRRWDAGEGQQVLAGVGQRRLDGGDLLAEHRGDDVELGADVPGVGLGTMRCGMARRPCRCRPGHPGQGVVHDVDPAALPGRAEQHRLGRAVEAAALVHVPRHRLYRRSPRREDGEVGTRVASAIRQPGCGEGRLPRDWGPALNCSDAGALGRIRTCNLLIRSRGSAVLAPAARSASDRFVLVRTGRSSGSCRPLPGLGGRSVSSPVSSPAHHAAGLAAVTAAARRWVARASDSVLSGLVLVVVLEDEEPEPQTVPAPAARRCRAALPRRGPGQGPPTAAATRRGAAGSATIEGTVRPARAAE
jgi:hypothetical protein